VPAPDPSNPVCLIDFESDSAFTLTHVSFARA